MIWEKLNGWKTIIGYVLVQIPWFTDHSMVLDAITKLLEHPDPSTPEGAHAWADLIVQLILLIGVLHAAKKNVKYGTLRAGQIK
jgi:hypothetical protein